MAHWAGPCPSLPLWSLSLLLLAGLFWVFPNTGLLGVEAPSLGSLSFFRSSRGQPSSGSVQLCLGGWVGMSFRLSFQTKGSLEGPMRTQEPLGWV